MGYLVDLATSLATQIDLVPTYGEKDALIRQLAEVRQAIGVSSGGGGGGVTSPADIAAGINQSTDVDSLVYSLDNGIKSTATPIAQTSIVIAAGTTANYIIPTCRCLIICINSDSLVHFTEDGSVPTSANCWFGGGTKEIWESNIAVGSTLKMLATSAATISFQPRVSNSIISAQG